MSDERSEEDRLRTRLAYAAGEITSLKAQIEALNHHLPAGAITSDHIEAAAKCLVGAAQWDLAVESYKNKRRHEAALMIAAIAEKERP